MKWDDPLPKYHEEENTLAKTIFGILSHYYHDGSEGSPVEVTNTFIAHVDMLHNQLLEIDDPELRLRENEITEILDNLPERVIDAPFSIGSIMKILEEQDKIEARKFFCNQASESPETANEHLNVGNAKLELGKKEEALRHYSEAISTNPGFLIGYVARASCLEALGKIEEALRDIEHIHEYEGNDIGNFYDLVSAADVAYRIGEYIYAIDFVIRAIELILNDLHRAQRNRNCIVVQIGSGTYYIYFETISRLIELIKDIETHGNIVIYILLIVAKRLIHDLREIIGI